MNLWAVSYITGVKGRNRVRVFERGTSIFIDYRTEDGGRVKQSLGHRDRTRAKHAADEVAAKFGREEERPTER